MDFLLPKFLYWQFMVTPQLPKTTFEGQTIIVTGGNAGLGLETVRHFVQMHAKKVIIACRSVSKGESAKADIEKTTRRTGVVEVMEVDLTSYASVERFASNVNKLDRLDIIVENAGISVDKWEIAEQEESTVTVNVVSTFLMALLVLPKLQESATKFGTTPHLCIMSSDVHYVGEFKRELKEPSIFDAMRDQKLSKIGFQRYAQTKLMEALYCTVLATRMNQSDSFVVLNYINPGLCHSRLAGDAGQTLIARIFKGIFARTTEVGARTEVAGAAAGRESHGKYINNGVIAKPSVYVRSDQGALDAQRLYDELNAKLEKIHPGITKNIK